ncbi:hypothetical protein BJ742DRAFT_29417 [Cladochytrium replicatum]|nr:hypothetical protein BJ742DRAFT_29417 [Cladochytrium replicatum]
MGFWFALHANWALQYTLSTHSQPSLSVSKNDSNWQNHHPAGGNPAAVCTSEPYPPRSATSHQVQPLRNCFPPPEPFFHLESSKLLPSLENTPKTAKTSHCAGHATLASSHLLLHHHFPEASDIHEVDFITLKSGVLTVRLSEKSENADEDRPRSRWISRERVQSIAQRLDRYGPVSVGGV